MTWRAFLTLLVLLLLAGVPAQAATIRDMLGRSVRIPDGPLRVVSLAPSLTEIVFALGRGEGLVGVTDYCDYPAAARSRPRVGGPATPDLERIVSLRPDVVLATSEGNPRDRVGQLTRLGVPVFAVRPEGYAGILASIETLGRVLQTEARAAALLTEIQGRVDVVRRAVSGRPRPRVLFLLWVEPLMTVGSATFIHDLIEMAGGDNVVRERSVPYPCISQEQVVTSAPEVILVASQSMGTDRQVNASGWNAWKSVPAVRTGRVIAVPADPIHRPGPRVAEGVERLARAIHPDAFSRAEAP